MRIENPYHEGELTVQKRVGAIEGGKRNAANIHDAILRGAVPVISRVPMAVLGTVDDHKNVWASVLVGKPGFMEALDERTVAFDLRQTARNPYDPFWENIEHQPEIGMLVIELTSRRRARINGRMTRESDDRLRLDVVESYPNCPQFIQSRQVTSNLVGSLEPAAEPQRGDALGPKQQALIRAADTFFVASAHPDRSVDASHRGGNPGFVRVIGDRRIRAPDYPGNCMYNTLGNFVVNAKAGLIFVDFDRHRTLQLIGRPEILWDEDDPDHETGGTKRYWELHVDRWQETDDSHQLQWSFLDYSTYNPGER